MVWRRRVIMLGGAAAAAAGLVVAALSDGGESPTSSDEQGFVAAQVPSSLDHDTPSARVEGQGEANAAVEMEAPVAARQAPERHGVRPMGGVPTAIDFEDIAPEHLQRMREDPAWVLGRAEEAQEAFLNASSRREREERRREYLYFMHLAASRDVRGALGRGVDEEETTAEQREQEVVR